MKDMKEWKLKALTDIWTGDLNQKSGRLIPTGLLGSIRWWFEVLVRGLGGKACDPTSDVRCPDQRVKEPDKPGHHCVVCELFGCTGRARKFRLMILDDRGRVIQNQIRAGHTFILRFIPLRPIAPEEWCLLDATLRLIADYGAIGGRTVFKPSEEWGIADLSPGDLDDSGGQIRVKRSRHDLPLQPGDVILEVQGTPVSSKAQLRQLLVAKHHGERLKIKITRSNGTQGEVDAWAGKQYHQDFGLVTIEQRPEGVSCSKEVAEAYVSVKNPRWRTNFQDDSFAWASLQNFWCVKGRYLARRGTNDSSFNKVLGRKQDKSVKERRGKRVIRWSDLLENKNDEISKWLAGRQQESKKVFSFKHPEEARRTFGFVKPGLVNFAEMKKRLSQAWAGFDDKEFKIGEQILDELFGEEEGQ